MSVNTNIGAIILAAGSSSRMGQSKQLLPVEGQPLLLKTTRTVIESYVKNIVIVLGSQNKEHQKIIESLRVNVVDNKNWQRGMGSSLKAGLKYLIAKDSTLSAVLILVCDQPLLSKEHLNQMIDTYKKNHSDIVASRYANTLGVPVLFDKKKFKDLLDLGDEEGAKKIIQKNTGNISTLDFPEGAVDLDTMEDYVQFNKKNPQ